MVKKGDTLIEVTIAIGIFSMIAVAIVAVMSNGSAGAQTALETTLAREEIDTQAEALRFIHSAYTINTSSAESNKYAALWNKITENAVNISGSTEEIQKSVLQYRPTQCSDLYSQVGSSYFNNAFVINTKALGTFDAKSIDTVYKASSASSVPFGQASTYPRLVYSQDNQDSLVGNIGGTLSRVEGIFVVAVKDSDTTTVFNEKSNDKASTFYDFFIRTCWYGSNAEEPSTISTVIRLYDPTAVSLNRKTTDDAEDETIEYGGDAYTGKQATYKNGSSRNMTLHHAADNITDEFPQFVFIDGRELQYACWTKDTSDYSDYKIVVNPSCLESLSPGTYRLVLGFEAWDDEWTLTVK